MASDILAPFVKKATVCLKMIDVALSQIIEAIRREYNLTKELQRNDASTKSTEVLKHPASQRKLRLKRIK